MELVIDSNCLIAALIKPGKTRELICSSKLTLYTPEHILAETLKHREEIMMKAGITKDDFEQLMHIFIARIIVVPQNEFAHLKEKARKLVTHPEDTPFMALALHKHLPIWSNDKELKYQSTVKIYSTAELLKHLIS